jgi:hypothetical protein
MAFWVIVTKQCKADEPENSHATEEVEGGSPAFNVMQQKSRYKICKNRSYLKNDEIRK